MIERGEIEAVSKELGIDISHVQRDYVFGWFLSQLYSSSSLGQRLVLKGGNCLRKGYFESGRYSRDLDFSISSSISDSDLGRELNAIGNSLSERANIEFELDRTRVEEKKGADEDKRITEARLYFRDFYGQESELVLGIRLDITQFRKLYLPVQEQNLLHPYSDADACQTRIRCVKIEELLATKMRCLLQRRHIADLFDLIYATFISKEIDVNRSELLSVFYRATVFGNSPGVAKGLFLDLPLESLKEYWPKFIACPKKSWFPFDDARNNLLSLINNLIPHNAIHDRSPILFPSSLRNPILEAGQSLTLLSIGYDRVKRLVEPYSLVFKTRKDGVAREYFYAYDTTGGRTSGPGLKTFVPGNIEFVENTDQQFVPRFEVELRKAGSAEIADVFRGRPRPRFAFSKKTQEYEIQCPYCRKRFKRTSNNTELRPHNDRYGNNCPGRTGHKVW